MATVHDSLAVAQIRPYERRRDARGLIRCVAALQDFERGLAPDLPPGAEVARRYTEAMLRRCAVHKGRIYVAEVGGELVGFVCVLGRVLEGSSDERPTPHALIGELYVAEAHRGRGLGRELLRHAEAHAESLGVRRVRVQVLAGNGMARALYRDFGFRERLVELEKPLAPGAEPTS